MITNTLRLVATGSSNDSLLNINDNINVINSKFFTKKKKPSTYAYACGYCYTLYNKDNVTRYEQYKQLYKECNLYHVKYSLKQNIKKWHSFDTLNEAKTFFNSILFTNGFKNRKI